MKTPKEVREQIKTAAALDNPLVTAEQLKKIVDARIRAWQRSKLPPLRGSALAEWRAERGNSRF